MSRPIPKRIFLTGGSGVLGEALIEALSAEAIIALRHRQGLAGVGAGAGIEAVAGSIGEARLGMGDDDYARIASGIDAIVHCASLTQFVGGERRIRETNIDGTRHVLALARAANAPIYYVSTAFVHPAIAAVGGENAYIASKRAAEKLLRESGHPLTILRPSIISGDSGTGFMPRHQGYHMLLSLLLREALPVLPVDSSSYVDMIPRDVTARLIAAIVRQGLVGQDYWLTLGRAHAPSARQLMDRMRAIVHAMTGASLQPPKFVSTEMYERLIKPAIVPSLPQQLIKDYNRLEKLEGYFSLSEPLPSSLDDLAERGIATGHRVFDAFEQDVRCLIAGEPRMPALPTGPVAVQAPAGASYA